MPATVGSAGTRGRATGGAFSIRFEGVRELDALLAKAARLGHVEIKRALRPAAKIVLRAVRAETPVGPTGRLRRSIKVKAIRSKPILIVAVDRKKALATSRKYSSGYPYVNWIISNQKTRAPYVPPNLFLPRGFRKAQAEAEKAAIAGLQDMLKQARFFPS